MVFLQMSMGCTRLPRPGELAELLKVTTSLSPSLCLPPLGTARHNQQAGENGFSPPEEERGGNGGGEERGPSFLF